MTTNQNQAEKKIEVSKWKFYCMVCDKYMDQGHENLFHGRDKSTELVVEGSTNYEPKE